jgi:hypothetical protein
LFGGYTVWIDSDTDASEEEELQRGAYSQAEVHLRLEQAASVEDLEDTANAVVAQVFAALRMSFFLLCLLVVPKRSAEMHVQRHADIFCTQAVPALLDMLEKDPKLPQVSIRPGRYTVVFPKEGQKSIVARQNSRSKSFSIFWAAHNRKNI